jgi:hypothetical protein
LLAIGTTIDKPEMQSELKQLDGTAEGSIIILDDRQKVIYGILVIIAVAVLMLVLFLLFILLSMLSHYNRQMLIIKYLIKNKTVAPGLKMQEMMVVVTAVVIIVGADLVAAGPP